MRGERKRIKDGEGRKERQEGGNYFSDQPGFPLNKFCYHCSKLKQDLENYSWKVELKSTCVIVLLQINLFKLRK